MRRVLALGVLIFLAAGPAAGGGDVVVRGGIVHTVSGPSIENGVVVVQDGTITAVGPAGSVPLPAGVRVLEAAVVTPGLVDAHTVVGLAGHLNQRQDQDQLDRSEPIQPELRAVDAYDARERLIGWLRSHGITTLHAGHAPGAIVSGQTMIVKTRGDTVEEAVVIPEAMIAATLGPGSLSSDRAKAPGTRSKTIAMLREALVAAQEHASKAASDEPPDRNLRLEALSRVLAGEVPLLVTAHRHSDIAAALRLADEFAFRLVLDGGAESYLLAEELAQAGVPVIVHPPMSRVRGERENLSMETPALLAEAGVAIALQSGYESYVPKTRVVLFEAGVAAAHGLGFERALRAITLDAARVLGIEARLGSLEVGKDGDLALFDGDPFEYVTHCTGTVVEGDVVFEGRQ